MKHCSKENSITATRLLRSAPSRTTSDCSPVSQNISDGYVDWNHANQWHSTPINCGKTSPKKSVQRVSTIREDSEESYTYVSTYTEASGDTSCESVEVAREHLRHHDLRPAIPSPPSIIKYERTDESSKEDVKLLSLLQVQRPVSDVQEEFEMSPPSLAKYTRKPTPPVIEGKKKSLPHHDTVKGKDTPAFKTPHKTVKKAVKFAQFESERELPPNQGQPTLVDVGDKQFVIDISSPDFVSDNSEVQFNFHKERLTSTPTKQSQRPLDSYWRALSPIARVSPDSDEELVPRDSRGIVHSDEIHVDTPEDGAKHGVPRIHSGEHGERVVELASQQRILRKIDRVNNVDTDEKGILDKNDEIKTTRESRAFQEGEDKKKGVQKENKMKAIYKKAIQKFIIESSDSEENEILVLSGSMHTAIAKADREDEKQKHVQSVSKLSATDKKKRQQFEEENCDKEEDILVLSGSTHSGRTKKVQDQKERQVYTRKSSTESSSGDELPLKSRKYPRKRKAEQMVKSNKLGRVIHKHPPCFIEIYKGCSRPKKQYLKIMRLSERKPKLPHRKWVKTLPQDMLEVF